MKRPNLIFFIAAVILLLVGGGIFVAMKYLNSAERGTPFVYSQNSQMLELWNDYKETYIEENSGRTIDRQQNDITTSEGQSYSMLRAVWMDDREVFDQSWEFTRNNLQREDKLISWKFGERADGSFGILTDQGGQNTASDADGDIALALMMAYTRWNHSEYLFWAKEIMASIWDKQVVMIAGQPVLVANDIERLSQTTVIVNPSYFAPYTYRLFAQVDPSRNWSALVDSSYDIIDRVSKSNLGNAQSNDLPPNWFTMDVQTGAFAPSTEANLTTHYGYDAFRTPWRLALDYKWTKDDRAKKTLESFSFLGEQWRQTQSIKAVYNHDGAVVDDYESAAAYGGAIGYFMVTDPATAKIVYDRKLAPLYSPDRQGWKTTLSYYDDNWAWFGMALYNDALPNLAILNN